MTDVSRCRPLLGTYVEIAVDEGEAGALAAIEAAFEAVATVHSLMSFHASTSELSRLNAAVAGEEFALHAWTVAVLRFARELHRASDGVFDPGVGAALVGRQGASITALEIIDDARVRVREAVCVDLGGVAKGFAVDRAIDALAARGIRGAIVNAGGDLRVLGTPRPVHVRRPDDRSRLVPLGEVGDGALATTAGYFGGTIVDPATGASILPRRSYTVIAPTCMAADGLTKVLALAGVLPAACARRWHAEAVVLG